MGTGEVQGHGIQNGIQNNHLKGHGMPRAEAGEKVEY